MEARSPDRYPAVTLFDTEARTLASTIVGVEYALSVWLPPGYATEQKTYPVVYVLDGNVAFGLAVSATLGMVMSEMVPAVIMVGIGIHMTCYDDWVAHRARDYDAIPDPDHHPEILGGAIPFLEFVETELTPFIEANYRADPTDRTLWGYSLGGHFVLYAMMKRPGLFRRLIAGSPAISQPFQALFHAGMAARRGQPAAPVKLAILVGELEGSKANVENFWTVLKDQNYAGVDLKTLVLADETHESGGASAYIKGLQAVFS
jgi:uncharacterized protein